MHLVEAISEVGDAVNQAKAGSAGYCSNFFASPQKLQSWISHSELFCDQHDGATFFLRKDRDFWHLYFCAANSTVLQPALAAQTILKNEPVVLDLIGKEPALAEMAGWFDPAGFRIYTACSAWRARWLRRRTPLKTEPDSQVVVASKADCQPILDLLLNSFDSRAKQIPTLYEMERRLTRANRVGRYADALAGLLFLERRSFLRAPLLADRRISGAAAGSGLHAPYFANTGGPAVSPLGGGHDQGNAIGKYEHYGYATGRTG